VRDAGCSTTAAAACERPLVYVASHVPDRSAGSQLSQLRRPVKRAGKVKATATAPGATAAAPVTKAIKIR